MHLIVNGDEIITMVDHPFYVDGVGFVNAGELRKGARLLDAKGSFLIVENIYQKLVEEPVTVYNFQVEDFHTYYVGENEILVHNAQNYNVPVQKAGKPGTKEWKMAVEYIKKGRGKGINVSVSSEEQARQLINEARPELPEYPRYTMKGNPGYEVHPIEPGFIYDLPHIKWQDWTLKKAGGANGHIFITGE